MRIGVLVDSACDLPADFISENNIQILPAQIRVDGDVFADERDPSATLAFYESHIGDKTHDAETAPFSVEQIEKVFLERLVLDFDYVFVIPVWSGRSKTYENATKASFTILSRYRKWRKQAGINGPFSMRVIDSKTLFAGVGIQAAETVLMAKKGMSHGEIRSQLNEVVNNTVGYMVPLDLTYIRKRTRNRGEKSVGLATYLIANTLDIKPVLSLYREQTKPVAKSRGYQAAVEKMLKHVAAVVRDGNIMSRHVCISYGGPPELVPGMPGYDELKQACQQRGLELLIAIMGVTAGVNVGAGALSVAYAGEYREIH